MFHICEPVQGDEEQNGHKFTCSVCNMTFGTICQLHNHFEKCSQDNSFIYYNKHKIVFPLSSLWTFTETRNFSRVKELILNISAEQNGISANHQGTLSELLSDLWHGYSSTKGLSQSRKDGKEYKNVSTDTNDIEVLIGEIDKLVTCSVRLTLKKPTTRKKEGQKRGRKNLRKTENDLAKPSTIKQMKGNKLVVRKGIKTGRSERKCLNKADMCNDEDQHVQDVSEIKDHHEGPSIKNDEQIVNDDRPKKGKAKHMNGKLSQKTEPPDILGGTEVECSSTISGYEIPLKEQNSESCETIEPEVKLESAQVPGSYTSIKGKEKTNSAMVNFKTKKPGRKKGSSKLQRPQNSQISCKKFEPKSSDTIKAQNQQSTESENSLIKKKCGRKKQDLDVCTICGKKVKRSKMKVHEISHSDVRPYKCKHCPKTYKYPEHLAVHVKSHLDVLPYYCEVCGQGFIDANRLKRHSMMHTDYRPYRCEKCNAGFVTKYKLDRHMSVHTGAKKLQCDLCGMRFAHKETLTQHISGIHKKERRFSCKDCNETFFTNYQLKCHAMKHSGLRPHKCPMCKSDYIERKELRRHMRKQHNMTLDGKSASGAADPMETDQSVNKESAKSLQTHNVTLQSSTNSESLCTKLPEVTGLNGKVKEHRANELTELTLYRVSEVSKMVDQEKYMYEDAEIREIGLDESEVNNITSAGTNFTNSIKSNHDNLLFSPSLYRQYHSTFANSRYSSFCSSAHIGTGLSNEMMQSDHIINTSNNTVIDERNLSTQNELQGVDKSSNTLSPDHCKNFLSL